MSEGFLSRWARVKASKTSPDSPLPGPAVLEPGEDQHKDPEQALAELPSIESLTKDSDFSAFLGVDVPEALRKAALSKLWASDPLFSRAEVYDLHMEDYGQPALNEAVKTAWEFGKGMADTFGEGTPDRELVNFNGSPENTQINTTEEEPTPLLQRTNDGLGIGNIPKD